MTRASQASRSLTVVSWSLLTIASLSSDPSSAKGGGGRSEDRYNPEHIESLPPDIRKAVVERCNAPKAPHSFANYTDNLQKVVLHFEHFYCGTGDTFCGPSGCLHQIYASSHGHYSLLRSYYAPPGD